MCSPGAGVVAAAPSGNNKTPRAELIELSRRFEKGKKIRLLQTPKLM